MRKILSIILLVLGIGVFGFGSYMTNMEWQKQAQVVRAEENQPEYRRPVIGPVRKTAEAQAQESSHREIFAAEQDISENQVTAKWFRGVGIAIFLAGIISFIYARRTRKD